MKKVLIFLLLIMTPILVKAETIEVKTDENEIYTEAKYFATTYTVNNLGVITETSTREVTEEEAQDSQIMPLAVLCDSLGSCIRTDYKELKYTVKAYDREITVTNTWLTMPTVRSYDIIAVKFGGVVQGVSATGKQTWSTGSQNYASDGTNTKSTWDGAGISMNLTDNSTTQLVNTMTVTSSDTGTNWVNLTIFVTYQHAQSTVTKAQSMSYEFRNSGNGIVLGNTILFENTSVGLKYDNMTGLRWK